MICVVASKDFNLAPDGFKSTDVLPECRCVIVLGAASSPEVFSDTDKYTESRNAMLTEMTKIRDVQSFLL